MSFHATMWAWKQSVENPLRKLILLHMADSVSEQNDWQSWYSLKMIGQRCDCSRNTVRRHLQALVDSGYLTMTKEASMATSRAAKYRLNVGTVEIQIGPSVPVDKVDVTPWSQSDTTPPWSQSGTTLVPERHYPLVPERHYPSTRVVPEPVKEPVSGEPEKKPLDPEPASQAAVEDLDEPEPPKEPDKPEPPKEPKGRATWKSYSQAYENRYGAPPVTNARVRGQIAHFVNRVGINESPQVAAYFLTSNKRWYVDKRHAIGIMLADAEQLHSEWITGNRLSSTQAAQMDRSQSNFDVVQRVIAKRRAEGKM